ncbi:MAG: HAD family hydrolase [Persicimonas sp.]
MKPALYFNLDLTLTEMSVPFSEITAQVFEEIGVPHGKRDGAAFAELFFEELDGGGQTPWQRAFTRYFDERDVTLDARRAAKRYVDLELDAVQPAFADLQSFVQRLTERVPVGVLTRGIGHVQLAKLDKLGLSDILDDVVISHEVGASKADGSLFRAAEERREAAAFVYVSTHSSDIRHAASAGWRTIFAEPEQLRETIIEWLSKHV